MNVRQLHPENDNRTATVSRVQEAPGTLCASSTGRVSSEERPRSQPLPGMLAEPKEPSARGGQQWVKHHDAQVGDFIQYFYDLNGFVRRDAAIGFARVIEVIDRGVAFIVDGGWEVRATRITAHVPMQEPIVDEDDDYYWCATGRKHR